MEPAPRPALEMIESEFRFEFLILLFDRPALMRQADQLRQRRGRGDAERLEQAGERADEAHRQQHQVGFQHAL